MCFFVHSNPGLDLINAGCDVVGVVAKGGKTLRRIHIERTNIFVLTLVIDRIRPYELGSLMFSLRNVCILLFYHSLSTRQG